MGGIWFWYLSGCAVALALGIRQAADEARRGNDISDLGTGLSLITALSWLWVVKTLTDEFLNGGNAPKA